METERLVIRHSNFSEPSQPIELRLSCGSTTWNVVLPQICDAEAYADIRWYFERYAEEEPFATTRAIHTSEILEGYARKLATALQLEKRPNTTHVNKLQVQVILERNDGIMSSILWECLEDVSLWPFSDRPSSVILVRLIGQRHSGIETPRPMENCDEINVLVLSARPQLDEDIGHRLVSKLVLDAALSSGRKVHVDIVRPGTLQAFKEHLNKEPLGFFDIVHFDVHGIEHDDRVCLGFLKPTPQDFAPDPIEAADIAKILLGHQVYHVILNACRSAQGSTSDMNIAATLISCGLSAVIAMSYKVSSSSVETFTRAFFSKLFSGERTTFAEGARLGRDALREDCDQITIYGDIVRVHNHTVPVCYESNDHTPRAFWAEVSCDSEKGEIMAQVEKVEKKVIGRENDILLLEHNFLLESNIGVLSGRAGTGKSALLDFLSCWWRLTNFIRGAIWFDSLAIDTQQVPETIRRTIFGDSQDAHGDIVDVLSKNRYLIIFDSWESMEFAEASSVSKQRTYLKDFLRAVHGGRSLIVFISRKSEGWLSRLHPGRALGIKSKATFPQVLQDLAPLRGIQLVTQLLKDQEKIGRLTGDEDARYLERVVKLAEGNPLALQILIRDFSIKETSIKEYYTNLLGGAVVTIDESWLEDQEGGRSVLELAHISYDLLVPSDEVLERRRVAVTDSLARGEAISMHNFIHAVPLTFFGLIWGSLPAEDLWWYVYFLSISVQKEGHDKGLVSMPNRDNIDDLIAVYLFLPAALAEMEHVLLGQDRRLRDTQIMCDYLVHLLLSKGYLEPFPTDLKNIPKKFFYRIHPLVTLVARYADDYISSLKHLKASLAHFQAFCINHWPYEYQYWNSIWEEPKLEMGLTFMNHYVALKAALEVASRNHVHEMLIARLLQCVPKGLFADASRYELIIDTWTLAFSRSVQALDIATNAQSTEVEEALLRFVGPPESPDVDRLLLMQLYALQLSVSAHGLMVAERDTAPGPRRSTTQFSRTNKSVSSGIIIYRNKITRELPRQIDRLIDSLKMNLKSVEYFNGLVDDDEFWVFRKQWFQSMIRYYGVEELPADQQTFLDLPRSLNSTSVPFSSLIDVDLAVNALLKEERYTSARAVLQGALNSEINVAGNSARNKSKIFQLLAKVDKREQNWDDAIQNLTRAIEIETSAFGSPSKTRRIQHQGKWARLYEKAGDYDSMMSYVRVLLHKANQARKDDPEVEIECLLRLYKLDFPKRNDSAISDIYILLRAALVSYRHESPSLPTSAHKGNWMVKFLSLTNKCQPRWVLGATDPRRQTLAIAFVLMMFGNLINFRYSLLLMQMGKAGREDTRLARELSIEFEERLFAENISTTSVHMPPELNYGPQNALFAFVFETGTDYLEQKLHRDENGDFVFPLAPRTPSTVWGNTATGGPWPGTILTPGDYICPTEIMLRLSGYIIEDLE